jgi:uncharacterized protein (DUF1800 family)
MNAPKFVGYVRSVTGGHVQTGTRRAPWPIAVLIGAALLCNQGVVSGQPAIERKAAAHFLEQATFGPSAADVTQLQTLGYDGWLNAQFVQPETAIADGLDTNQVRNVLFLSMANAPDQLRQRMVFALSQIIVISANKNGNGEELIPWIRLLSRNAFGNYRTLLREVTVSPTMGKFLDGAYSKKASATSSPNENYPRELMQLFTIGLWELNPDGTVKLNPQGQPIPTYTQETVREHARALTGWTFPTMPGATPRDSNQPYFVGEMLPRVNTHDAGAKTLIGGTVLPAGQPTATDMEALIDTIFNHPNVPPFVATRLIRSLVTSNPSPAYIQRVANVFANNGNGVRGDLKATLTAILVDPEAMTFGLEAGRLKDPILATIGLARALGAAITDPNQYQYIFNNLNERVLTPQSVFSFFSPLGLLPGHLDLFGPEFQIYPPALAIQRANFIYYLLNSQFGAGFTFDLAPYKALAANPAALVEQVNQVMMFGRMSNELRDLITTATNAVPASDTAQRALGALYLAAISSESSVYSESAPTGATGVQPPTGVVATSIVGNVVTLRWKPPTIGPAPTMYVFEGGVHPGEVLAQIPTGSVSPTFTFTAPPGSFYVRVRTLSSAGVSRASSEIRVHVAVETGPTAPTNLLGMVKGSAVSLSWQNTFGGGAPTSLMLDVSGSIGVSVPLPLSETFTFDGVPPGTYKFSVRAINAAGTSGGSNTVTLTFPTNCSGSPQPPTNFIASANGNIVSLDWQSSTSGPAATSYRLTVAGPYVGNLPITVRSLRAAAPRGTYTFTLRAVNACGTSGATAPQTVTIP